MNAPAPAPGAASAPASTPGAAPASTPASAPRARSAPAPGAEPTPHDQLGLAFKAAMIAVRRLRGRETHRPGALSNAQYGLLLNLGGECDAMSARQLAKAAALTPATVTQMLEGLEAAGLVQRLRSERDRRVVLTGLTARGREIVEEHRARVEPRWRAALSQFDADELRIAAAVLSRLARYFDAFEDD